MDYDGGSRIIMVGHGSWWWVMAYDDGSWIMMVGSWIVVVGSWIMMVGHGLWWWGHGL